MKKIGLLLLIVAMVAAIAVFAAPAMADDLPSIITSYKWYDFDMDGLDDFPDASEPGIPGWKIELLKDGVVIQTVYTDANGWYAFAPVMPGTYVVREGVAGGCWMQTFPSDPNYHTVVVTGNGCTIRCQTPLGNVCVERVCGGFTPGFWSNKNGQAILFGLNGTANQVDVWLPMLKSHDLVNKDGTAFNPTTYADFRAWLLGGTATNMSYKLSVQKAATLLNINYKGADYSGYYVKNYAGDLVTVDELLVEADAFLATHHVTIASGPARTQAEFYKDIFDHLNNNTQKLTADFAHACAIPWAVQ